MDLGIGGRTALVAGGSAGLGGASAQLLAAEGANLVVSARGEARLNAFAAEVAAASGVKVTPVAADHSTEEGRAKLLAACPNPDILVISCSPPAYVDDLTAIPEAQWLEALHTAFLGPIALMSAVLPGMGERGFGRIVNIGTVSGKAPWDRRVLSGAPRSALLNYVHSVSKRFADKNVTLNTLLPGMFATEAAMGRFGENPEAAMLEQARKMRIPAGRFGRPEELAQACVMLCGAQAGFITGQSLVLDGGATTSLV
jgi:3-oxoacyl-[acyl-carrier protein] reductase